jgi:hypothetical protein
VIELIGLSSTDDTPKMSRVLERAVVEKQTFADQFGVRNEMPNIAGAEGVGTMDQTVHLVVMVQEPLAKVRTVLSGDPGDESFGHYLTELTTKNTKHTK